MAYGIANLGSGFIEGFRAVDDYANAQERQRLARDEMSIRQAQEARAKEVFELNKADGEELAKLNAAWIEAQQQRERGVQMGPPTPDGQWEQQPGRKLTLIEAEQQADAHLQKIAPLLTRMYARVDPKAAAEFSIKLGDAKSRSEVAQQVALGKMLLANPSAPETRDALVRHYKDIPDGYDIDPQTYRVDEKGNVRFEVFNKDGERKPTVIVPGQVRGMVMMGLTPQQIAQELGNQETRAETARHHGVTENQNEERLKIDRQRRADEEENRKRDDKRAEREFNIRMQELRLNRSAVNERARLDREAKAEGTAARERDEVYRGIRDSMLGDTRTLQDLSPEEQEMRLQGAADAADIVELNKLGKTSQAGMRAAAYVKQIASGNARVFAHKTDPAMVIVDVGGTKLMLPKNSYTMNLYNKAPTANRIPK